jgi:hypothetical protein
MGNEYQAEQEELRLKSVEFWRGRVQELTLENSELLQEIKRLRDQRDFFAFEAITNQMDDTDWSDK